MSRRTIWLSLMICSLMLVPTALAQGDVVDEEETEVTHVRVDLTDLSVNVNESAGRIDVKLGASKMHLKYGTDENPGGIQLLTKQKVFMGIADLHRDQDERPHDREGIAAMTIFYQNLPGIVEYEDANGDGLFNVHSNGKAGSFDELSSGNSAHEDVIKWIDFDDVSWQATALSEQCDGGDCELSFSLTATNLSYSGSDTTDVLESLTYVFKLTTREVEVQHDSVKRYDVRHHQVDGEEVIDASDETTPLTVNATVIRATWKYDQIIIGWDVATDDHGDVRNDTRLMQFVDMGFGSYMDDTVAQWAKIQFDRLPAPRAMAGEYRPMDGPTHDRHGRPLHCGLDYVQAADGHPSDQLRDYKHANCVQRGEEIETGRVGNASAVRAGALHFDDDGRRFGSLRWVSNATVDGVETEVLFQIHGHRPVLPVDVLNMPAGHYRGVRLTGGYNLEMGAEILHDPEYETDLMDVETMSFDVSALGGADAPKMIRLLMMIAGLAVVGLVGIILTAKVVKGSKNKTADLPKGEDWQASSTWQESGDWRSN